MGLKKLLGVGRWRPDPTRQPPPPDEWPKHVTVLKSHTIGEFVDRYPVSVVDFWASWCRPCSVMKPRFRELEKEYRGRCAFGRLDVESNKAGASEYKVLSLPTFIVFSYGKPVKRFTGVQKKSDIARVLDEILDAFE